MQEKLLVLRERNDMSKTFVANHIGITPKQYSAKEKGLYEFTSDEMFKIKDLFDEKMEDIFLPRCHQNGDD